jgi:hypothetical protein
VSEYLVDYCRVFSAIAPGMALPPASLQSDAGDDADIITTFATGFDIDIEHAFQSLCPGYCQGWHVCRFCRSKNRSLMPGAQPALDLVAAGV